MMSIIPIRYNRGVDEEGCCGSLGNLKQYGLIGRYVPHVCAVCAFINIDTYLEESWSYMQTRHIPNTYPREEWKYNNLRAQHSEVFYSTTMRYKTVEIGYDSSNSDSSDELR